MDFALANQWEASYFFKNESPRVGSFLGLHLLRPIAGANQSEFKVRPGPPGPDTRGFPAIGAGVTVTTAEGKVAVAQVDGGSGFSGRSSPTIHVGLGSTPSDQAREVRLVWRDAGGQVQNHTLGLKPGWHTVVLGTAPKEISQK